MTVEINNYAIAIATLSCWLKNLYPIFQPIAKAKPIATCTRDISRVLSKLRVIARNSHWFIALFGPVEIGWLLWSWFSTVIWKPLTIVYELDLLYILKNVRLTFFKFCPRTSRRYTGTFPFSVPRPTLLSCLPKGISWINHQMNWRIKFAQIVSSSWHSPFK